MFDDQTRRMVLIFGCIFVGVVLVSITMEWTLSAAPRTPNVDLGPDHTRQANTGETVVYHHILTNTGTTTDTFWLDLSSTQGWPVELWWGPYPTGTLGTLGTLLIPQVGPQMTIPLRINLTVPSDAAGVTEITIITATSQLSSTVQDTATDTTIVLCKIYLPLVVKGWPPMPYSPTLDPINNIDGNGFYTVTWSLAESAQTYSLEEDDNDGFSSPTVVYTGTGTSWSVPEPGKMAGTYYYRVRGRNEWGYGEYSDIQMATTLLPDAPLLYLIDNSDLDSDYNVTWSAVAGATGYTLQQDTNIAFTNTNYVYTGVLTSWSALEQADGTFYYRVQTSGPTGDSEWSNIQSVDTIPPPSGVYLHHNHSSYAHPNVGYSVVGEIWNNTGDYLHSIQASAKFYNEQGQLVDTINRSLPFDLAPGNKICFSLDKALDEVNWDRYELGPLSYMTDGAPHPQVTTMNDDGYLDSPSGFYGISGDIRNDHAGTVDDVKVQGTLYNVVGTVIDCGWQYANTITLLPGQQSAFELIFTGRDAGYNDVHSYRVQAEADEQ